LAYYYAGWEFGSQDNIPEIQLADKIIDLQRFI